MALVSRQAVASLAVLVMTPLPVLALGGSNTGSSASLQASAPPVDAASLDACATPPEPGDAALCRCDPGAQAGSVWGTGPFTADSDICTAARFAGAVGEEGGAVRLIGLPGREAYEGGNAHGVKTSSWGSYRASFDVEKVAATGAGSAGMADLPKCGRMPADAQAYDCRCEGSPDEAAASAWGVGPFTGDSSICAAALFTGYVEPGTPSDVHVLRAPGLSSYLGDKVNGVTTREWGAFDSSFVFDWNR